MAGIYIHIPFCAKKCFYCDFFMSLSLEHKKDYLSALKKELKIRKNYLQNQTIETVYLGGGTPSLLNAGEINDLFSEIYKLFNVSENPEITLEANPDDLSEKNLKNLKNTPVNRLSIGIQSFFEDDLKIMNRRHSARQSIEAVKTAQNTGFDNISGDLIYGLPNMTSEKWQKNLDIFFNLNIPHLSAYHLTYEPNTVFFKKLKNGKHKEITEEESLNQFKILINESQKNKMIHYETSNFARENVFSKHNFGYWQQKHYLGAGASAHSYDGNSRQFNIKNLKQYIEKVRKNEIFFEKEILSDTDKYNDYIITTLRTVNGCNTDYIRENIDEKYAEFVLQKSGKHIKSGNLIFKNNILKISEKGKFTENLIIEDLFYA